MKSATVRFLIVLALLLSFAAVSAQDATPEATPDVEVTETPTSDLSYSSPVIGQIDNTAFTQTWPLQTASADRITIQVERVDGNLIPSVALLDSIGTEIANSYGADATAAFAEINNFTLPTGGEFQVVVGRDGGETGVTGGHYRLIVIPLATAADNINNTTDVGTVSADTPLAGEITATHWYQRYTYTAAAPDAIRVIVERTSGTLAPEVEVLDANDAVLTTGYTNRSGDSGIIDSLSLPAAGEFTIAVTRASRFTGVTEGGYSLTVELLGSGMGSPNLQSAPGMVEYDTALEGAISNQQWYQDWTLTTQAADALSITAQRTDGNLRPVVILLGGGGQELNRAYTENTGDSASLERYTLQTPGTFTIRVTREGDQTGATSGAYTLTVNLIGSGAGSPNLAGSTGALAIGKPAEGEITSARWADTWTYTGTANESINVTVQRASGTLIPLLEVRDVNGQTLTSGYYDASRETATLRYTIPSNGEFQIVVLREDGQTGATTGGYTLTVTRGE